MYYTNDDLAVELDKVFDSDNVRQRLFLFLTEFKFDDLILERAAYNMITEEDEELDDNEILDNMFHWFYCALKSENRLQKAVETLKSINELTGI